MVLQSPVERQMHLHVLMVENQVARNHTDKENILMQFHAFYQQNAISVTVYRLNPASQPKVSDIFLV